MAKSGNDPISGAFDYLGGLGDPDYRMKIAAIKDQQQMRDYAKNMMASQGNSPGLPLAMISSMATEGPKNFINQKTGQVEWIAPLSAFLRNAKGETLAPTGDAKQITLGTNLMWGPGGVVQNAPGSLEASAAQTAATEGTKAAIDLKYAGPKAAATAAATLPYDQAKTAFSKQFEPVHIGGRVYTAAQLPFLPGMGPPPPSIGFPSPATQTNDAPQLGMVAKSPEEKLVDDRAKAADLSAFQTADDAFTRLIDQAVKVRDDKYLKDMTGAYAGSVLSPNLSTSANRVQSNIDTLVGQLTLGAMNAARQGSSTGATGFGALSEKELSVLQSAVANLKNMRVDTQEYKNKLGQVIQYATRLQNNLRTARSSSGLPMPEQSDPLGLR